MNFFKHFFLYWLIVVLFTHTYSLKSSWISRENSSQHFYLFPFFLFQIALVEKCYNCLFKKFSKNSHQRLSRAGNFYTTYRHKSLNQKVSSSSIYRHQSSLRPAPHLSVVCNENNLASRGLGGSVAQGVCVGCCTECAVEANVIIMR